MGPSGFVCIESIILHDSVRDSAKILELSFFSTCLNIVLKVHFALAVAYL